MPYVIEPAAGATRTMMAFLLSAYDEDEVGGEARTVLRLHWRLAPYQVAVLPLSKKEPLEPFARQVLARCSRTSCATTTPPRASASATGARTRWDAVVRHRRLRLAGGRRGHRARPRQHRAGAGAHRRPVAELRRRTGEELSAGPAQATLRYLRTASGTRTTSSPTIQARAATRRPVSCSGPADHERPAPRRPPG